MQAPYAVGYIVENATRLKAQDIIGLEYAMERFNRLIDGKMVLAIRP
jgi:hypothetical protein